MTTQSANSTTPAGAEQALKPGRGRRLDRRQHQERLDHRLSELDAFAAGILPGAAPIHSRLGVPRSLEQLSSSSRVLHDDNTQVRLDDHSDATLVCGRTT